MPATSNHLLGLIGNTPLLQVHSLDTGCCELFLKLEARIPADQSKTASGVR